MAEVKYPRYRTYIETWRDANDAMMALLAGSRLATHTLMLTDGSDRLLPEIFPAVPHIGRFNLKTAVARELLRDADEHLGAVAVPYALAVHEDYVTDSLEWLSVLGLLTNSTGKSVRAWNMHTVLFESCDVAMPPELLLFHVLREMRNCQIHAGGGRSSNLDEVIANLDDPARSEWVRLTDAGVDEILVNERVRFTTGHIIAAFAITKALGRSVNAALQNKVPAGEWACLATSDYLQQATATRNSDSWLRALRGYARQLYGAVGLSDDALEEAARSQGHWTRPTGAVLPSARQRSRRK